MPEVTFPLLAVIPPEADVQTVVASLLSEKFSWAHPPTEHPDLQWLNAPDEPLTIERVRSLPQVTATKPIGDRRFLILANLHTASIPAQNALLKILEEPPTHTQFILLTTNTARVLPTVLSRTQIFNLASQSTTDNKDPAATAALYNQITSSSYATLIELAETYSDRSEAGHLLRDLTQYVHFELTHTTDSSTGLKLIQDLRMLLQALEHLEKNANVRLVIEDTFFQLRGVK